MAQSGIHHFQYFDLNIFFCDLFIPTQFAAIANAKAAIFFPTPFGPVKSSALGINPFCKRVERNRIESS
jgi:hypothetical protein